MGLIAHPIKNIPALHLEASHFCLEKIKYGYAETPASRQSRSAERVSFAQRGGLSCIPQLVVSQAKPCTTFPHRSGRQVPTSCMRDRDHPKDCKFLLPLQTACLSFVSHICSPAAHAQGNKEDAFSPQAKSWVSAN